MLPYVSLGLASHSSMAKLLIKVKGNQGVNHSPAERGNPSPMTPSPAPAIGRGLCEGKQTTVWVTRDMDLWKLVHG